MATPLRWDGRPRPSDGRDARPAEPEDRWAHLQDPRKHNLSPAVFGLADGLPFANEPLRDFADAGQRDAFARAASPNGQVPKVAIDATTQQAGAAVAGRSPRSPPGATWTRSPARA